MYSHIKVITIFLRLCSYVLKKENPKNSKNHQSYGCFKNLSNFIIILNISITTIIAPIDTYQELLVVLCKFEVRNPVFILGWTIHNKNIIIFYEKQRKDDKFRGTSWGIYCLSFVFHIRLLFFLDFKEINHSNPKYEGKVYKFSRKTAGKE